LIIVTENNTPGRIT